MPKKKKDKDRLSKERKERKQQRLLALAQKDEKRIIMEDSLSEMLQEEDQNNIRCLESEEHPSSTELGDDEEFFRSLKKNEKTGPQEALYSFTNPVIYDIPEFLINPEKEEERREVMEKVKYLLKHRFSLITIADILETNDYARLDEIIERRENADAVIEKYSEEEGKSKIKLFSGFKKIVGEEYSRVYAEQEERMKAAITILTEGKYFKNGLNAEELEKAIDDIIASVIDHPDFNLACQIEAEFVMFEIERAEKALSDLRARTELQELLEELRKISLDIKNRADAYRVMTELITGRDRKIIPPAEGIEK